jgi:lipopolysaccharide transport system permease protein
VTAPTSETISPAIRPRRTLRPPSGWASLNVSELWEFRDLLVTFALRDTKLRYRQTALGVLWVLFQPLLAAGIFTFVFNRIVGVTAGAVPYFLFAFAGQIAWMCFASTLTKTSNSLVTNAALVSKVFFPRLMLPLSTVLSSAVDFLVGAAVLVVCTVFMLGSLSWTILLLPVWFLLISLMALGIGLIAGAFMVSYRDVQYIVPVLLGFLMYFSPVAWPLEKLDSLSGGSMRSLYLALNPLASLIEAFRWSFFGQGAVPWAAVAGASVWSVALFFFGAFVFRNQERRFADVI